MISRAIVYIVPRIPYPLDYGMAIRQFYLLSAYSKVGKVKLVFFYRNEEELKGVEALTPYCISFHPVSLNNSDYESNSSGQSKWKRRMRQIFTLQPTGLGISFSREMQKVLKDIVTASDLVHVARLRMVPQMEFLFKQKIRGQRFILDLDDIETVVKRRSIQTGSPIGWRKKAFEYYELMRLWLYQEKALRSFDRTFVCSEKDKKKLINNKNVRILPNGAMIPPKLLPYHSDGRTCLIIGALSYGPNIEGLHFFLKEIFPLIQKDIPDVRLFVVGRSPTPEVLTLHDGKTIIVEPNVPSVEEFYQRAAISVVPLKVGGGTRLKILESFALGRPVVTTSVGCEGLDVTHRRHLLIADSPEDFARSCIDLLKNSSLADEMIFNARKLVEQKYSWSSIQNQVINVANELRN